MSTRTNDLLLQVLQSYAPNSEAQQECSKLLWRLQEQNFSSTEIDLHLASRIKIGLTYSNWPWTKAEDAACMCVGFMHQPNCNEYNKDGPPF